MCSISSECLNIFNSLLALSLKSSTQLGCPKCGKSASLWPDSHLFPILSILSLAYSFLSSPSFLSSSLPPIFHLSIKRFCYWVPVSMRCYCRQRAGYKHKEVHKQYLPLRSYQERKWDKCMSEQLQQNFRNAQLCMAQYDQGPEKRRATVPWESQGEHTKEVTPEGNLIRGPPLRQRRQQGDSRGGGLPPKREQWRKDIFCQKGCLVMDEQGKISDVGVMGAEMGR